MVWFLWLANENPGAGDGRTRRRLSPHVPGSPRKLDARKPHGQHTPASGSIALREVLLRFVGGQPEDGGNPAIRARAFTPANGLARIQVKIEGFSKTFHSSLWKNLAGMPHGFWKKNQERPSEPGSWVP
jgi:hypothetical protein